MDQNSQNDAKAGRDGRAPMSAGVGLGLDIAIGFALLTFGGYWLDQRAGGGGIRWTLAGAGAGFLFTVYEVWKVVRRLREEPQAKPATRTADDAKPDDKGRSGESGS